MGKKPKDPVKYTDRVKTVPTETGSYPDLRREERRKKLGNLLTDASTNLITIGTQLRYPTQAELERARSGRMGKAEILAKGITTAMLEDMGGKLIEKGAKAIGKGVNKIPKKTKDEELIDKVNKSLNKI